jgi:hypothetical protein
MFPLLRLAPRLKSGIQKWMYQTVTNIVFTRGYRVERLTRLEFNLYRIIPYSIVTKLSYVHVHRNLTHLVWRSYCDNRD